MIIWFLICSSIDNLHFKISLIQVPRVEFGFFWNWYLYPIKRKERSSIISICQVLEIYFIALTRHDVCSKKQLRSESVLWNFQISIFFTLAINVAMLRILHLYIHSFTVHGDLRTSPGFVQVVGIYICLTSVTLVKCGIRSTLCWKIRNISGSIELFAL